MSRISHVPVGEKRIHHGEHGGHGEESRSGKGPDKPLQRDPQFLLFSVSSVFSVVNSLLSHADLVHRHGLTGALMLTTTRLALALPLLVVLSCSKTPVKEQPPPVETPAMHTPRWCYE